VTHQSSMAASSLIAECTCPTSPSVLQSALAPGGFSDSGSLWRNPPTRSACPIQGRQEGQKSDFVHSGPVRNRLAFNNAEVTVRSRPLVVRGGHTTDGNRGQTRVNGQTQRRQVRSGRARPG
jgi:hypothetical protein